jgi:hypothetical protein
MLSRRLRRRRCVLLAVFLLVAMHGSAQQPSQAAPLPVFEFHSSFWMNLHHFLYQQARLREQASNPAPPPGKSAPNGLAAQATPMPEAPGQTENRESKTARGDSGGREPVAAAVLTPAEQQAWTAALNYYAGDLAGRDLLFNGDMANIKNRLAELEACEDLSGRRDPNCDSGLRRELVVALERAAPVYRARWWPTHDRLNRSWTAGVAPLVRQFGGELARQLSDTYQADWPTGKIRVDAVAYAGSFGAYTTLEPVRVTLSSADARNQGPAALEVLFHEASHALAGAVRDAIARECRMRGKPIPRDLWHALLFYTTGEMVRRALTPRDTSAARGAGAYTPYAYRFGLYSRGWSTYQRVLERYWQPYLDGKVAFDTAVARLVSAL